MATTGNLCVVYGLPPYAGPVRVEVPEKLSPSSFRRWVRQGQVALHGPSNTESARCGLGFRFLWRDPHGGWSVGGPASVAFPKGGSDHA